MNNQNDIQALHVMHYDTFSFPVDYKTFLNSLENRLSESSTTISSHIILYIEFYGFPQFCGSELGLYERDNMLIDKIGRKLLSLLGKQDIVARIGDFKYVVLSYNISYDFSDTLTKQIMHTFSEPCTINGQMFYVYTSIGIAYYPFEGEDIYEVIRMAEAKMKQAKQNGRNLIGTVMDTSVFVSQKQSDLKIALPAAIENGEITFVYQAQYSQREKCFTGAEILARWEHPVYGKISPSVFIPLAEQSGMIVSLSIHAIVAASKAFVVLENENMKGFSLSVNISPLFLLTNHFSKTLEFLVEEYALDRYNLHFEITEEMFFEHTDYLMDILKKIKTLGIKIELDDFGTGYTSVKQLADLPLDTVKVDRSFIRNIDKDSKKKNLLKAIIEMTKALGIDVIAEGVETQGEDNVIIMIAPLTVQGYLYGKPESLEQLIERIRE